MTFSHKKKKNGNKNEEKINCKNGFSKNRNTERRNDKSSIFHFQIANVVKSHFKKKRKKWREKKNDVVNETR